MTEIKGEMEKNFNDRIFVVLATYNRGEKCVQVIRYIIDQNISNWYLLIVDDGSEEVHSNIITTFVGDVGDNRVEYIKNSMNMRLPSTLNIGIDRFLESDCEYFTWISDDNYYSPNYLKNLYSLKADFAHSAWSLGNRTVQSEYKSYEQVRGDFKGLASYMWGRKAVITIGYYNPEYELVCDLEYLYKTFKHVKEENIGYSPHSEMKYIIHENADSVKHHDRMRSQHARLNGYFDQMERE